MKLFELLECFIQIEQPAVVIAGRDIDCGQFQAGSIAPAFAGMLLTRSFDQDPSHRFSSSRKEMPPTIPLLALRHIHESQISFVHQGRRLKRLPGFLVGQFRGGEFAEFFVNEGYSKSRFSLDRLVNFSTVNRDLFGRLKRESHGVVSYFDHLA